MSITGCILAKNEEQLLAGSIKSLQNFVDEIIVVDNGSDDSTPDIAISMGCKLISSPDTLMDQGRNKYLENVKTDWVCVLDADERYLKKDIPILKDAIKQVTEEQASFRIPVINYTGNGEFIEISSASKIFRSHPNIRYGNQAMHSSVYESIQKMGKKEVTINFPIHHFDILLPKRTKKKRNIYMNLLEKEIAKPVNPSMIWFQYIFLAVEILSTGNTEEAIKILSRTREKYPKSVYFTTLYLSLINLNLLNDYDLAEKEAEKILKMNGRFVDRAIGIIANINYLRGKKSEAIKIFKEAIYKYCSHNVYRLNLCLLTREDDLNQSQEWFQQALSHNKLIKEKFIYVDGNKKNTMSFQSLFLANYRDLIYSYLEAEKISETSNYEEESFEDIKDMVIINNKDIKF